MTKKTNIIEIKSDPIELFKEWFYEAKKSEINNPNAMNLATVSKDFVLSSRMVLLKSFDNTGFVFYTNLNSKKSNSIYSNPKVALNFYWKSLRKQIKIEGKAVQISDEIADEYFSSRQEDSKIGTWASKQSSELKNREDLNDKFKEYHNHYKNKKIPRPSFWSGFRVEPVLIEFWQEMPFRLHDRVEYIKNEEEWIIRRLYP
tara:strand:- start:146 stop:751 length:606 start_codon:yes stop_codon:yes gene_type:complete